MPKYGLIIDRKEPTDYVFGGGFIGTKEINPSGDWPEFLPREELQNLNGLETMNCPVFTTLNCIEILINFHFHKEENYSERFTGIMSGTQKTGNSPQVVAQNIRKVGLIPEKELPFSNDIDEWDKYYSPWPMLRKYITMGREWLEQYDFSHEYVFDIDDEKLTPAQKHDLIKLALKRSPVGLSVFAWMADATGKYIQLGNDNHFCTCYGLDENEDYKMFDTYDNTHKIYSKEANVKVAKLYWIEKNTSPKDVWFVDLLKRLFSFIINK
jgi:hypothetical protein